MTTSMPPWGARCNTISSMKLRMRKMPRPLAFRRFSGASGSEMRLGIESRTLVTHANDDARRPAGIERRELDVHVLVLVAAVAVLDRVDDRLAHGDAHPVERLLVESGETPEMIARDLHEVEHLVRAVELETDGIPVGHESDGL